MRWIAVASSMTALSLALQAGADTKIIEIKLHADPPPSPVSLKLPDDSLVTFKVEKRPNETCALETQREELKPGPEPLSNFIAALARAVGLAGTPELSACKDVPTADQVPNLAVAKQVERRLAVVELLTETLRTDAESQLKEFVDAGPLLDILTICRRPKETDLASECASEGSYKTAAEKFSQKLSGAIGLPLPSTDGAETQLSHINDLLKETQKIDPAPADAEIFFAWLESAYSRVTCRAAEVRRIKDLRDQVAALRDPAGKVLQKISQLEIKTLQNLPLPADKNSKVTGKLVCRNVFTDAATISPVPLTITYEGLPRLSVTAGVLYSTLDKRKIGTEPVQTGETTFRTEVTESRSSSQLIPFSFLDVRLADFKLGKSTVVFGLGLGVGVNSNNGSKEVEYFLGPSLAIKNIHLHVGLHHGRLAEPSGGYEVGETVPSEKFPGVPVARRGKDEFAIGISYRLPLS